MNKAEINSWAALLNLSRDEIADMSPEEIEAEVQRQNAETPTSLTEGPVSPHAYAAVAAFGVARMVFGRPNT